MSLKNQGTPEGILLVDKPRGITSHDVVSKLRRIFQIKKIGHAGTLDPMATGLLVMLIGKATKVSQYMMSMEKEYTGSVKLGQVTDSQDAEGEILEEHPVPELTEAAVLEEMKGFLGDQYQPPPMFSAKKINGQKLYKLARRGQTVEREPRVIHISKFEMLGFDPLRIDFRVGCSKGTYVRTIAHDLGEKLGCGGHLCELRRTGVGSFRVEDSDTIEGLEKMSPSSLRRRLLPVKQTLPSHVL